MILLDTNVLSELMRPAPAPEVMRWFETCTDPLALSVISIQEITYGITRLPESQRQRALVDGFIQLQMQLGQRMFGVTTEIAILAGTMQATYATQGRVLQGADALIAGTCVSHGATLATRNTKDFDELDLRLMNPWLSAAN
jgi:predicted nucleic acid-binding protein